MKWLFLLLLIPLVTAETADIDTSNNAWPKKQEDSDFDKFKSKIKG